MGEIQGSVSFPTRELVSRARGGDPLAVEALYLRYLPVLQRWARGRMPPRARDLNDTEDLVQETLTRTLRRLSSVDVDRPGAFFAYLRMALLNRIRDEARRVSRTPQGVRMQDIHATSDASPIEALIGREKLERFEGAMETLSLDDREAIMARIELNLTYAEVAAALGKPSADAARMTVTRALAKLASAMGS
ncbi:MAG: sigma-70 family RNA polymerase sigma factor [Vicinamibacteria bacterium]|nr:sigma-70 family RNA polymerase sigma factor [Vicinamibacteria bacterium]